MRPEVDATMQAVIERLVGEVQPALPAGYGQSNLTMLVMLLAASAEQWDNAAAWRAEENAALKALFAEAAPLASGPLGERLAAAAGAAPSGLRISELNAENDALRALLIDLHEAVEEMSGEDARRVEAAIWDELAKGCARRRLHSIAL